MRATIIYRNDKNDSYSCSTNWDESWWRQKATKRGNKKCQVFRIRKKTRRFEKTETEKMRKARIWRWWRCLCRTISTMLDVVSGCFEVTDISLYISQSISQFPRNSLSAVCFTFNREQPLKTTTNTRAAPKSVAESKWTWKKRKTYNQMCISFIHRIEASDKFSRSYDFVKARREISFLRKITR